MGEPIIDELIKKIKDKLINGNILPKSKLRVAMGYFCSLIPYIKNFYNILLPGLIITLQSVQFALLQSGEKIGCFLVLLMEERPELLLYLLLKLVEA